MSSDNEQRKKSSQRTTAQHVSSSSSATENPEGRTQASPSSTSSAPKRDDEHHHIDSTVTPQSQQSSILTRETPESATKKQPPGPAATSDTTTYSSTPERNRPRQVIAVSASKGPAAFFNLARKFLVTDEMCDLSALEGAIVSAADAAHLLERSELATIVRVQTSYVVVEPKQRRRNQPQQPVEPSTPYSAGRGRPGAGRDVRRARIVITVKRTESYRRWLEANPLQAVIAGDGDEGQDDTAEEIVDVVGSSG